MAITQKVLANIYDKAVVTGTSTNDLVAAIKACRFAWLGGDGKLSDDAKAIRGEFYIARMFAGLKLETREAAQAVYDLKPFEPGSNSDTRRTLLQERAYKAAKSAWGHVGLLSGMPKLNGGVRAPKVTKANVETVEPPLADIKAAVLNMPKAETVEDVHAFALRCAEALDTYQNRNPKHMTVNSRPIFAAFIASAKALAATKE